MSTRILLADDHALYRQNLRVWLANEPDLHVVADVGDGLAALQGVQDFTPDVVVMDVVMPRLNGIEATHQIVAAFPAIKVIALSMFSDRRFVAAMLEAGASSYVLKGNDAKELVEAIRAAVAGQADLRGHSHATLQSLRLLEPQSQL